MLSLKGKANLSSGMNFAQLFTILYIYKIEYIGMIGLGMGNRV